jgi:hypothetical protein
LLGRPESSSQKLEGTILSRREGSDLKYAWNSSIVVGTQWEADFSGGFSILAFFAIGLRRFSSPANSPAMGSSNFTCLGPWSPEGKVDDDLRADFLIAG